MARDLSGGAGELGERRGGDRRGAGGEETESLAPRKSPAVDGDTGETRGARRLFHRPPTRAPAESATEAPTADGFQDLRTQFGRTRNRAGHGVFRTNDARPRGDAGAVRIGPRST